MLGESPAIRRVIEFAQKVALRRAGTVLLMGETGTGKELFARGIHYGGRDPEAPFVAVNCPSIPASLLESELFGHEKGAFTDAKQRKRGLLELAGTGTIFLDEVGDLPPDLQPKLLRALEERRVRRVGGMEEVEIRCRVIAATNGSLEDLVAEGKFREDLFYRLNVVRIQIPPLRERVEDVEALAGHFIRELAQEQGIPVKDLSADAIEVLRDHGWPGNVRELKNVIHRAALLADGDRIRPREIVLHEREAVAGRPADRKPGGRIVIPAEGKSMEEIEAEALVVTLRLTEGNKSAAARILGYSRPTVHRKIERYGLGAEDWGEGAEA